MRFPSFHFSVMKSAGKAELVFHVTYSPRGRQAKNVLVEFFVLHLGGPFPSNSTISHSKAGWSGIFSEMPDTFCEIQGSVNIFSLFCPIVAPPFGE
jgi:hypothetical protein